MTYTEAIDSLFVMLENICSEIDYIVLVESSGAETSAPEQESKIKKLTDGACKILKKIWETIKPFIDKIKEIIIKKVGKTNLHTYIKLKENCNIHVGFLKFREKAPLIFLEMKKIFNLIISKKFNNEIVLINKTIELLDELSEIVTINKSKILRFSYYDVVRQLSMYSKLSDMIDQKMNTSHMLDMNMDHVIKVSRKFYNFIYFIKSDLMSSCDIESINKIDEDIKKLNEQSNYTY